MPGGSTPTCCARRCSRAESMPRRHLITPDARRHPQRAHRLAHRRVVPRSRRARAQGRVLPYEGLVARFGTGRGVASGLPVESTRDLRRRRGARADHSQWIARADHLSRGRAALDRGARGDGDELAPRDRALGRQVLYDRAAAGGRAADARDRVCERAADAWRAGRWRWATW